MAEQSRERLEAVAQRRAEEAALRIGDPCEHHSGCQRTSTHGVGWWYPSPGSGVFCEEHARSYPEDVALPPLPTEEDE